MIDPATLTTELRREVTKLEDDLRARADAVEDVGAVVEREWQLAHTAGRTAYDLATWREGLLTQVAVAWVLGTVFVRFCEDNGLLRDAVLAGPGDRTRHAEDAQRAWFRDHAADGERGYVAHVFSEMATLPGLSHVFEAHNPVWLFGPSDDAVRGLLGYWREIDPDTGVPRRDLTDPSRSTRFLGDLYQDLSESARKQYALLQTPEFVEEFILDRTLDPAIEEFGLDGFRMIDPACGSGHFLLGAFDRLFARWQARAPQDGDRANAEHALRSVFGIDLNPFAASIARFRLLVAALQAAGVATLAEAPRFTINVAVGDSLLHGPAPGEGQLQTLDVIEREGDPASRHLYATEDAETINRFLWQRYHAVVANPPYITPKDPAAREVYRRRFSTCHGKYALSVPFMQRLFDLAERGASDATAGFVGQITANSFTKREFGKPLIERLLAREVDVSHVIDTSGAYIPGHGTPTVILFGRNRQPASESVRAVLGIRGEPGSPSDPSKGSVWSSIVDLVDKPGAENAFVSVVQMPRSRLARHPWSIQGGGADIAKATMEEAAARVLLDAVDSVGVVAVTGTDDAFVADDGRLPPTITFTRSLVIGEVIRDHRIQSPPQAVFPYADDFSVLPASELPFAELRFLWPARATLASYVMFGRDKAQRDVLWYEWGYLLADRLRSPLSIVFAFVGTHNHFVLDRGGKVFKQSAPVIKLRPGSSENEHLELLGPLNSATGCFWMQQVFHNKGAGGGARVAGGYAIMGENFENHFEFDSTKLRLFPLPRGSALSWASRLDTLAQELSSWLPASIATANVPTREHLDGARSRSELIRREMVAVQEELDWRCLHLYGITEEDLSLQPDDVPTIDKGERAFEIVLARRMRDGEVTTTWFDRHGSTPIPEIPAHWPEHYRELVQRRIDLITSDRFVGLVERPEYKRRWNWESWEELEAAALRSWLLDRLEDARFWPEQKPRSAAQLADDAARDPEFVQVAQVYAGIDVDLVELVSKVVRDEAVPFLSAWRYTDAGLRKREAWERTWALQRREDAGEDVGTIPVPPKYGKPDFADGASWRLRGKLDVPKERFIAYPSLGRDGDPTPLVGWAGWDHLAAAQALAAVYEQRRSVDGWESARLVPILGGIAELVPWLQQWHNEPDPATGLRLGDFFAEYVQAESAVNEVGAGDLAAWRPVRKAARKARA